MSKKLASRFGRVFGSGKSKAGESSSERALEIADPTIRLDTTSTAQQTVDLYSTKGDTGIRAVTDPTGATIDIVFVHGLTGNRDKTWTHANDFFWPLELAKDIRTARIMTFGYDADVVKLWGMAGSNNLRNHGKSLAFAVSDRRRDCRDRPIIFIAHSLGGLVCEQALLICGEGERNLDKVFRSTKGIIFMGTPHGGADLANWGYTLAKYLNIVRKTNRAILGDLRQKSEVLTAIQQQFQQLLRKPGVNIEIYCFFEEKDVIGVGAIVSEQSAVLSQYPNQSIAANHMDMTKFSGRNDEGYQKVLSRVHDYVEWINSTPAIEMSRERSLIGSGQNVVSTHEPTTGSVLEREALSTQTIRNISSGTAIGLRDVQGDFNMQLSLRHHGRKDALVPDRTAGPEDLACLRSLAFPEMNYRRRDTERAHAKTCGWITRHLSYTTWLEDGYGILWIKGKPGSGKSTLMEFLLRDFEKQAAYHESIQLSFFLHGRGTILQKSRLGMYRSLLHQLLRSAPTSSAEFCQAFQERSRSEGDPGKDWDWHVNEIRAFFMTAVEHVAKIQPVSIFVDALDEASDGTNGQNTSRQIVSDFHNLNDRLLDKKLRSRICFSCRHQPVVADNQGQTICVEDENQADISLYVRDELHRWLLGSEADPQYLAELQDTVVERAQGVFQWAVLVVHLMIDSYDKGRSPKEIRQLLDEVPGKLGEVYEHILRNVIDKKDYPLTLRLLRWVCLTERPLTVTEMRFAMALPEKEIFSPKSSLPELESQPDNKIVKRISSLSGGLIETKQHKSNQIVQFIHQSVNDFLLADGLQIFDKTSGDPIGQGHHQLSLICANYMIIAKMDRPNKLDAESIKTRLPFVDYVVRSWFLHAEKAETRGVPQDYLLRYTQSYPSIPEHWVRFYRTLDLYSQSGRLPEESSTMLHIASSAGLLSVVKGFLLTHRDLEEMDGNGNRALHHASRWGHTQVVKALLDAGADFQAENKSKCTVLERAAANGHEEIVRLLLSKGAYVNKQTGHTGNALYGAAAKGSRAIVRMLLDNQADVHAQGGQFGNALQAAAYGGHQAVVQLLLDQQANVNAQGGEYGNALQAAALEGHQAIVQLLLDQQADVHAQGGKFGNALQAAALEGHQAVVQLLLDQQADVHAQSGQFGNALQAAAYGGHQAVVQLLLDQQADVNAQGGVYGNALQAAAFQGHQTVVQLLLDQQADVNAQGGKFGNALQAAAFQGHQTVVQLLLDQQADVNAQGGVYGNALQAAAFQGHQAIVQLLLDQQADVHAQGGVFGNALQAAAFQGHQAIVQLLLDQQADVHAQGGVFGNALQAAAFRGHQAIVQLLLDQQADVNAQGGEYSSALQAAAFRGHQAVVQLLLDQQADVNAQSGVYGNALQAAAFQGHQAIVQLLLDQQADVNAQGGEYSSALQAAALEGHQAIVQLLLDQKADVICQDNQGRYPLHLAIRGGHYKLIDLVLSNIDIPDWKYQDLQGCSALHFAASGGSDQIVQVILKSNDVDINLVDTYGWTALHWACRNGNRKIVHMLRGSGADSNRKDINGWTPLDVATFCQNDFLASLFQDNTTQAESKQFGTRPGNYRGYRCGSCYHHIYGSRHNCKDCRFFNLCFRCIIDVARIHQHGHKFEVIAG